MKEGRVSAVSCPARTLDKELAALVALVLVVGAAAVAVTASFLACTAHVHGAQQVLPCVVRAARLCHRCAVVAARLEVRAQATHAAADHARGELVACGLRLTAVAGL